MDVYLEKLCEHCGVVRVGASSPFPSPYQYSVTYVIRGAYAEPVGFDHPKISPTDFQAIISSINQATGKLVAYDRAGMPPSRVVQIDPRLIKGKILMSKHAHHVDEAKRDGAVNQIIAVQHTLEACAKILGGSLTLVSMKQEGVDGHPQRQRFTFEADAH